MSDGSTIYGIVAEDDPWHIRYIGKTHNLESRTRTHNQTASHNPGLQAWKVGRRILLIPLEEGDQFQEAAWIETLRASGHDLFNAPNAAVGRKRPKPDMVMYHLRVPRGMRASINAAAAAAGMLPNAFLIRHLTTTLGE